MNRSIYSVCVIGTHVNEQRSIDSDWHPFDVFLLVLDFKLLLVLLKKQYILPFFSFIPNNLNHRLSMQLRLSIQFSHT